MTSQPGQQDEPQNDDEVDERSLETTEADFSEQHAETASEEDENEDWLRRTGFPAEREASVADTMEQLQEVEYDEDDYR